MRGDPLEFARNNVPSLSVEGSVPFARSKMILNDRHGYANLVPWIVICGNIASPKTKHTSDDDRR
jgi:hypothetical protein